MDFDPFQILQVSPNASESEIIQARRRLARVFHPDVSQSGSETEEVMKKINRAFDVLTDPEKRRQFLDKTTDDQEFKHSQPSYATEALKGYEFRSKEFSKKFNEDLKEPARKVRVPNPSDFYRRHFKSEIDTAYTEYINRNEIRKLKDQISLDDVFESVEKYFYFKDDFEDLLSISLMDDTSVRDIVFSNRNMSTRVSAGKFTPNDKTTIVNLRSFGYDQLRNLLLVLEPKKVVELSTKKIEPIVDVLVPILPQVTIEAPKPNSESKICFKCNTKKGFFESYYNCVSCGERFCLKCLIKESKRLPRLGFISGKICQKCNDENEQWEVNCWFEAAASHMKSGLLNKALFLFRTALDLDESSLSHNRVGRNWVNSIRSHDIRAVFLFDILSRNLDARSKTFYMNELGNCLQAVSATQSKDEDKYQLCLNSLKVYLMNGDVRSKQIDLLKENILSFIKKASEQAKNSTIEIVTQLNQLICYSNLDEISSILVKKKNSLMARVAVQMYLDQTTGDNMDERAKIGLLFARGVFNIFYGLDPEETLSGFNHLELAYWKSLNFPFGSAQAYVRVLTSAMYHGIQLPFEALFRMTNTDLRLKYFLHLIPKRENLKPTQSKLWSEISLRNKNLRPFKIYEKAIYYNAQHKLMGWTRLKTVLSYIDLIDACENYHELIFCFIQAAAWALDAMDDDNEAKTSQQKYAFSRIVFKCVEYATYLSYMYLDTVSKACVFSFLFGLGYHANRFDIDHDNELVAKLFKYFLFGSSLIPVANMPLILVSEAAILSANLREVCESFFGLMVEIPEPYLPMEKFVYKYVRFEANQHSVRVEDEEEASEIKLAAMSGLLDKHGIDWPDVADYIDYPLVERTRDGWLAAQKKLNIDKKDGNFSKFNGFKINKETHEVTLLLETATGAFMSLFKKEEIAKFNWADIGMVMSNYKEATFSYFSLDPIDERLELHPFQKFLYSPKYIKGSNFLHTLFHTDYLLKQFSMGVEVNCMPPFNIRSTDEHDSTASLLKPLPAHLQEALKSTNQRGQRHSKVSRMWIQAERLEYHIDEKDDEIVFLFGDLKMCVKTHPMKPNSEGQLVDTETDPDRDSPEYKFASDLTENYEEISEYFPEFARLKELCKLQYLGMYLKSYLDSFDSQIETNTDSDRLLRIHREMLEECRKNTANYLDKIVREIKKEVPSNLMSSSEFLNAIADKIHSAVDCALVSKSFVKSWLEGELNSYWSSSSKRNELVDLIADSRIPSVESIKQQIETRIRERKSAFERAMSHQISLIEPIYKMSRGDWPEGKTEWVPALFKQIQGENRFVYGGVVLCPTMINKSSLKTGKSDQIKLNTNNPGKIQGSSRNSKNRKKRPEFKPKNEANNSPPVISSGREVESTRPDYSSFLFKYRSTLMELFPDPKLRAKFQQQLLTLITKLNECRRKFNDGQEFKLASTETFDKARKDFDGKRDKLRKEWEKLYGIEWPKEVRENKIYNYEMHHIIPLEFGGPNEVWNMIPVKRKDHRGKGVGLHSTVIPPLEPMMRDLCSQGLPTYKT